MPLPRTSSGSSTSVLQRSWAHLRSSLWPLPVLAIVVAIGLGIGLPAVDEMLRDPGDDPLRLVFGGGPTAARDVLAAIAGSLISVTGLTFSFTVVALQLSSSQHSPRLLQTFVTDRVVQNTLALLIGTFVYALTVLRTVRTQDSSDPAFVPRLSVTVCFVLAVVSVVGLVLFLGHLARSLRVETMLRDVSVEARRTYAAVLPETGAEAPAGVALPPGPATPVCADSSGFVVDVDADAIARAAAAAGALVLLEPRIGDPVVAGTPVAHVWPAAGEAGIGDLPELERALRRHVHLAFERKPDRDVGYSLRKVVDIAVRALSPGTNDPTTAVHALNHVSALLGELVSRPLHATTVRDGEGVLRVVLPSWEVGALLRLGLEEPLHFASGQPAVLRRLARLLRELAWSAPSGSLDGEIRRHLDRVVHIAEESTDVDATETGCWREEVSEALAGRWPAPRS